jgi:uncharacterized membrane protein YidH (DUF202 family)
MVRGKDVDNFAILGFAIIAGSVLMWLAGAVWAITDAMKSRGLSLNYRLAWSFVAIALPLVGPLVWLVVRSVSLRSKPA